MPYVTGGAPQRQVFSQKQSGFNLRLRAVLARRMLFVPPWGEHWFIGLPVLKRGAVWVAPNQVRGWGVAPPFAMPAELVPSLRVNKDLIDDFFQQSFLRTHSEDGFWFHILFLLSLLKCVSSIKIGIGPSPQRLSGNPGRANTVGHCCCAQSSRRSGGTMTSVRKTVQEPGDGSPLLSQNPTADQPSF
jgi:hypothetical protein